MPSGVLEYSLKIENRKFITPAKLIIHNASLLKEQISTTMRTGFKITSPAYLAGLLQRFGTKCM